MVEGLESGVAGTGCSSRWVWHGSFFHQLSWTACRNASMTLTEPGMQHKQSDINDKTDRLAQVPEGMIVKRVLKPVCAQFIICTLVLLPFIYA